jgi:hypothetical protein
MNLQRMKILRHGKTTFAVDNEAQQSYPVVNPGHIPAGMEDGIFSIDTENRTAQFESRHAEAAYVFMPRKKFKDTPPSSAITLPNRTSQALLLGGRVAVTRTDTGFIVDAPDLPKDVAKLVAALALAGYDVLDPRLAEALRYMFEDR